MPSKSDLKRQIASLQGRVTVTGQKLDNWVASQESKKGRPVTPEEVEAMLDVASFLDLKNTITTDLAEENQELSAGITSLYVEINRLLALIETRAHSRLVRSSREARVRLLFTLAGVQPPAPSGVDARQAVQGRIQDLVAFFAE